MKPQEKHTPTPWKLGWDTKKYGYQLQEIVSDAEINGIALELVGAVVHVPGSDEERKANAEFIIRAVNEYDQDKATIKALLEAAEEFLKHHQQVPQVPANGKCVCGDCSRFKDAIAQVKEVQP